MAIHGVADPRFALVRDAFSECFTHHGERGGAVCVISDGRVVVDLWGGTKAAGLPWEPDTLVNVFSVGKALIATAAARLVGQGLVDLDEPLASRWPGFAAAGKESVTLRHVLTHTAGLPAIREPLPPDAVFSPGAIRAALEHEAPFWGPGSAVGYHVNTFGFLAGAALERAVGRSTGTYLREEVCGPIGADFHIGLSADELLRVAPFHWPATAADQRAPGELQRLAYRNPETFSGHGVVNTERWRRCEHPSANAHASARGVARLYGALLTGAVNGYELCDPRALAAATVESSSGDDLVLGRPSRFGLGFQLTQPQRPIGWSPRGFGHFGAGGSLGLCDPARGIALGYVTSTMGPRWQNPKNRALTAAVAASL